MAATIEVTFDDKQLVDGFARLAAAGRDARQLTTLLGSALVDSTRLRFTTNIAPDGTHWAGLNPAYVAFRRPGPILVQSSALRGSVTFRSGSSEVMIGSGMIYAGVHQGGAVIVPKSAKALVFRMGLGGVVRVRSVTIPARPYLGISAEDRNMIIEESTTYLERVFSGR